MKSEIDSALLKYGLIHFNHRVIEMLFGRNIDRSPSPASYSKWENCQC